MVHDTAVASGCGPGLNLCLHVLAFAGATPGFPGTFCSIRKCKIPVGPGEMLTETQDLILLLCCYIYVCVYIYIYIHICIYVFIYVQLASTCNFYYILLALIVTIDLFILIILCTYMPYHTTPCQTRTYHIIQLIHTYIDCHRSINTCSLTAHVASVLAASRSTKRVPGCSRLGSAQLYRGEKRMLRMLKISDFV